MLIHATNSFINIGTIEAAKEENKRRRKEGKKPLQYLILVATSGDTGKAALEGYKDKKDVSVIVLYPENGVSNLQKLSMVTQEGNNLNVLGVEGNFDDTQRLVKKIFNDRDFNRLLLENYNTILSSANSINWGRLLPQSVYHLKSYLDLINKGIISWKEKIDVAIPTGNFGNILAAFYAKKMGLPIRYLICGSNENNVLTDCLRSGIYDIRKRNLVKTPSPSMDILVASNFERLLYEITRDSDKVKKWMKELLGKGRFKVDDKTLKMLRENFFAGWVSNKDCLYTISKTYKESNYLPDPHTAVVQVVVERFQKQQRSDNPLVINSTAHWSKFPKDVYKALSGISSNENEFAIINKITKMIDNDYLPENIMELKVKAVRFKKICKSDQFLIEEIINNYLKKITNTDDKK